MLTSEYIGIEFIGFLPQVVKNEGQMWGFKNKDQITFSFVEIESKEDKQWMDKVMDRLHRRKDYLIFIFGNGSMFFILTTCGLNLIYLIPMYFNVPKQTLREFSKFCPLRIQVLNLMDIILYNVCGYFKLIWSSLIIVLEKCWGNRGNSEIFKNNT